MGRLCYTSEVKHVNGRLALELVVIGSETTKCNKLDEAKSKAIEQYMECMFKHKHGIPTVSKRFADVAKLSVAKMNRLMEAGEGRRVYVDYISVIQNYLIPFVGKFNVANINHQQVSAYEQWRLERIGRVMRASTVSTHNFSFSNCANWLNWLNCAFAI